MGSVISLKDGSVRTIMGEKDLLEIVEDYAGYEAAAWIEEHYSSIQQENKDLLDDMERAEKDLQTEQEENMAFLNELSEEVDALEEKLDSERLDRKALRESVRTISRMLYEAR